MAWIQERKLKDGKSSFTATIRMKGHPPVSASFLKKTEANKWISDTESAIRNGRYFKTAEARKRTLAEMIDRYIENVLPRKYAKERDREGAKTHLNWWKSKLGHYCLIDVTPVLLAECREKLLKEPYVKYKRTSPDKKQEVTPGAERFRSNSTVNRYMASLSVVFTEAINEWGWLEENPALKVKKKKEPRGRVRFLSDEERVALLDACKNVSNPNLYIVVVLALTTGARFSEIISLKWEHVDLKRRVLYFLDTKNKDRRSVPISQHAYDLLEEHKKVRRIDTKYVFPGTDGHKPLELKRQWENAIKEAKLKDFRFHDLRHTAASYLAMNGASLLDISHILGHRTLQMVQRYSHLTENHVAGVLERMNEAQFGKPQEKGASLKT